MQDASGIKKWEKIVLLTKHCSASIQIELSFKFIVNILKILGNNLFSFSRSYIIMIYHMLHYASSYSVIMVLKKKMQVE